MDTQIFFFYGFYNHSLELRRISFVWYSFWHNKSPHLLDSISYLSNKWGAVHQRTEYTDEEFCEALEAYRDQNIQESIRSDDPIVRMFVVLDRRVGKRTLQKLQESFETQPDWVRQFYLLRVNAETGGNKGE